MRDHKAAVVSDDEKLLTEEQAAEIVGVSPFTLARQRKAGRIAYHRPGGGHLVRYSRADVRSTSKARAARCPQRRRASSMRSGDFRNYSKVPAALSLAAQAPASEEGPRWSARRAGLPVGCPRWL